MTSLLARFRSNPATRRIGRTLTRLVPDVRWTVRVGGVGPLRVRLRRHRWLLYGEMAREEHAYALGAFARLVRPGDVVYDIGANIGLYTRLVAARFSPSMVIAFEPMRDNFELLQQNIRLGGIDDIARAAPIALGDRDGSEILQIDDVSSGSAALDRVTGGRPSAGREHAGLPPSVEQVTVRRLDVLLREESLPPPNMMKIDTEGAEGMVLAGAVETLKTHRPRLAIATHGAEKAREALTVLEQCGYLSYGLMHDGGGLVHRRIRPDDAEAMGDNNFIASCEEADVRKPIEPFDWSQPYVARSPTGSSPVQ